MNTNGKLSTPAGQLRIVEKINNKKIQIRFQLEFCLYFNFSFHLHTRAGRTRYLVEKQPWNFPGCYNKHGRQEIFFSLH